MTRRVGLRLALVGVAGTIVSAAPAAEQLPVRAARVADAAPRDGKVWAEWWRLHGIEPRTGRYFTIEIQTRGVPPIELRVVLFDIRTRTGGSGADQLVNRGGGMNLFDVVSLTRSGNAWRLVSNHRLGEAQLTIRGRPGVTVGPWRLGRQPVYETNPPQWERASISWSALVPAGRVDGWVSWGDVRYDVGGWHAYLDHTWGRFRDHDEAWDHWDKAVSHRGPGESWVLQGLEPGPGFGVINPRPDDRLWRGVLVHATPRGVTTCRPTIRRSGWGTTNSGPTNPDVVAATCKGRTVTFRRWPGQNVLADRSGLIEHRINFFR